MSVCDLPFYNLLFVCLSVCLSCSPCLPVCLSAWLAVCLSVFLSVCLSVCLAVRLAIFLNLSIEMHPSGSLAICLTVCLQVCLPLWLSVHQTVFDKACNLWSFCLPFWHVSRYLRACLHVNPGMQHASRIGAPNQQFASLHFEHDRLYCEAHLCFRDTMCMQG